MIVAEIGNQHLSVLPGSHESHAEVGERAKWIVQRFYEENCHLLFKFETFSPCSIDKAMEWKHDSWKKVLTCYRFSLNKNITSKIPTWRSTYSLLTMLCKKANPMKNIKPITSPSVYPSLFLSLSLSHTPMCRNKLEWNIQKEKHSTEYHLHFFNFIVNNQNLF